MTREEAIKEIEKAFEPAFANYIITALTEGTTVSDRALEQKLEQKCKWIHYDYRTMCPKEHDVDNPYWRIPENRMDTLKYCPYCGKEIEVEQ